jgi:hypothetical protein
MSRQSMPKAVSRLRISHEIAGLCHFAVYAWATRPAIQVMSHKKLYKVVFLNHGKVYEVFAKSVAASDLYGFTVVSELVFGSGEGLLVDPAEEKLKEEFADTQSLHLPMHSIVRVEEVRSRGTAKIRDQATGEKIMPFPTQVRGRPRDDDSSL